MKLFFRILQALLIWGSLILTLTGQDNVKSDKNRLTDPGISRWEEDIRVFDSLNRVEEVLEHTVLFTGSSSIRRWDSLASDMAPYHIIKRGYGGAKLSDFSYYLDRIVSPDAFRAIVIFIANDISGNERDKSPEEVFDLFRQVAGRLRKNNPESEIFWIEITPTPSRWEVFPEVQQANEMIRRFCNRKKHMYFISTSQVFLNQDLKPDSTYFVDDMLHLNRSGYRLWSELIGTSLREAGVFPAP